MKKPTNIAAAATSHNKVGQTAAIFVARNAVAVSAAALIILGGGTFGIYKMVNHSKAAPTQTHTEKQPQKQTDSKLSPDAPTVLVKDPATGEVKAVSQNEIAKDPSLMNHVITNPTASDYQSAGIAPPTATSGATPTTGNLLRDICSTTTTPYFYGTGAQADDHSLYCPSFDSYCRYQSNMTSFNGCRTIKPSAPAVPSWTTYKVDFARPASGTASSWAYDSSGKVICQLSTDWLGQFGLAARPSWLAQNDVFAAGLGSVSSPLKASQDYNLCAYRTSDGPNCKTLYLSNEQAAQIEGYYDSGPSGRYTYVCKLYKAHQNSFNTDFFQCSYYRVKWEPIQRSDGSWYNNYMTYQDKVFLNILSAGNTYTFDINLCKGLFAGTTVPDTTNNKLWLLPNGEYVKYTNGFSKTIDNTGTRYDINHPPPQ